jgi:hypothetical protein
MYDALGIHWASSIPAFLGLACVPFPFIFYKYGELIRLKCKYAAEAAAALAAIRANDHADDTDDVVDTIEEKDGNEPGFMEKKNDSKSDLKMGSTSSI